MRAAILLLAGLSALAHAVAVKARGECPAVWTQVNAELNSLFLDGGKCNDAARGAMRAVFHDCGSWDQSQGKTGGCDGSLLVGVNPDVELDRIENKGLQSVAPTLTGLAEKYNTSKADMIVFAGNAAIFLCPGGPKVRTWIGRKDSTTSAKPGGLPSPFDSPDTLLAQFSAKGYSAEELAGLLGAHSTSTQRFVNTSMAGASQDSTPGVMDVNYYQETYNFATTGKAPSGVFVFPSDSGLATSESSSVGRLFQGFIGNHDKWSSSFQNSMERMTVFGNDVGAMKDCSDAIEKL